MRNVALVVFAVIFLLAAVEVCAEETLQVVDVEANGDNGQPSLLIKFNQTIRYRGVTPNKPAREFTIQLEKQLEVVQGRPTLDIRSELLRVKSSKSLPISRLELSIDGNQVHLNVSFSTTVSIKVGQFSGANSLSILLPEARSERQVELVSIPGEREKSMFESGKRALQQGDSALAIRLFSKLISLPENPYSRDALEFLGVSRERNNQLAQAKLIYQQYLKKFPKDDDASIRVKQRLAELLLVRQQPKEKLKASKRAREEQKYSLTTISQNLYRGLNSRPGNTSIDDQEQLSSRLTYQWRKRTIGRDVRHFIYANHIYDFVDETSEFSLSTAYSRIKDTTKNYSASVGRQSSQGGGVLGRYDGMDLAYGLSNKMRFGVIAGSPVDTTDKQHIQTDKRFYTLHIDFVDLIKDWNFSAYTYSQTQDGYTDRKSVGTDIRYFSNGLSLFNQVDYDTYFSEMTTYLLRMQNKLSDQTSLIFNVDYRYLLEASSAIGGSGSSSLSELYQTASEAQIIDLAKSNTAKSTLTTLGMTHSFANLWNLNFDLTRGTEVLGGGVSNIPETTVNYYYVNALLSKSNVFKQNDLLFISGQVSSSKSNTSGSNYSETSSWISHRLVYSKIRWLSKLKWSRRDSQGALTNKIIPSAKMSYRFSRESNLELEVADEIVKYGGDSLEQSYNYLTFNLGYELIF